MESDGRVLGIAPSFLLSSFFLSFLSFFSFALESAVDNAWSSVAVKCDDCCSNKFQSKSGLRRRRLPQVTRGLTDIGNNGGWRRKL